MKKIFKVGMIFILCLGFMGCDKVTKEDINESLKEHYKVRYEPTITDAIGEWSFMFDEMRFDINFTNDKIENIIYIPSAFMDFDKKVYFIIYDNNKSNIELDDLNDPNNELRVFLEDIDITYDNFIDWIVDCINENTKEIVRPIWEGKSQEEVLSILNSNGYEITTTSMSGMEAGFRISKADDTGIYLTGYSEYSEYNKHKIDAVIHSPEYEEKYELGYDEGLSGSPYYHVIPNSILNTNTCKWYVDLQSDMPSTDCNFVEEYMLKRYVEVVDDWLFSLGLTKEELLSFIEVNFRELGKDKIDIKEQ